MSMLVPLNNSDPRVARANERGLMAFRRGAVDVLTDDLLLDKLNLNSRLRVKFGIDPTTKNVHLGHMVPVTKLRQLQDLGHECILIIGDFTATIGDPSGRKVTRPKISYAEVKENMSTYIRQMSKVVDVSKIEILYNSDWLSKLNPFELIDIMSKATLQQMMERRDFSVRFGENQPISMSELVYPLLVGYDSVVIRADVEIGGTDQLFNFMVSKEMQRAFGQAPEVVITLPLLVGTDGKMKMSKSYGNAINVEDQPTPMYMKIMSISDALMLNYYELVSMVGPEELEKIRAAVSTSSENPMIHKMQLAYEITERYHGKSAAEEAQKYFDTTIRKKTVSDYNGLKQVELDRGLGSISVLDLVSKIVFDSSRTYNRSLITQGAVSINDQKVTDPTQVFQVSELNDAIVRAGKKTYVRIVLS